MEFRIDEVCLTLTKHLFGHMKGQKKQFKKTLSQMWKEI